MSNSSMLSLFAFFTGAKKPNAIEILCLFVYKTNCCSFFPLKLKNSWTDLAIFDLQIFSKAQGRFKR